MTSNILGQGGALPGNAYGSVPGPIQLPTNIYSQVNSAIPGAQAAGAGSAGVINSQINGQVNPETQNLLQDKAAAMGVQSGQPTTGTGNTFSNNNFLQSLGIDAQNQENTGVGNYLNFLQGVGSTMTNPNLQFEVSQQNAIDAAAPNPQAAAQMQQFQFQQYLQSMSNPGGGTGAYGGQQPPNGASVQRAGQTGYSPVPSA